MPSDDARRPRVRGTTFSISLDGFAAGPDQSREQPLGAGGERLHGWAIATRTFHRTHGREGGVANADDARLAAATEGVGATIMGRNMFGPVRGAWGDESWRGWWGDEPPFHHPVFVLTHHPRRPLEMAGGTTFHFVTDGPEAALARAVDAAGGRDVAVGGGAATLRAHLRAGLLDELNLAVVPIVLGAGERLFEGVDVAAAGYEVAEYAPTEGVAHMRLVKAAM